MKTWLLAIAACGAAPKPVQPVALSHGVPLDVTATAVVEQGDALYVLADRVATIVRNGVATQRIESPRPWSFGASIAAPDGDGRWVVAVDDQGAPWRLTQSGEREPVGERLGLPRGNVHALGGAGATFAADLGDAVAYTTDGKHLVRVPADEGYLFAVAHGVLARGVKGTAALGPPHLEKWDLVHGTRVVYPVAANAIAFLDADGDHPHLAVLTDDELLVEDPAGKLAPAARLPARAHDLVTRGARAWIAAHGELFVFERGTLTPTRHDDRQLSLLAASSSGDAWIATEHGLARFSSGASAADAAWQAQIAPVFQRVCAHCHLPGGEAGIDLSTPAAWASERSEIANRVLATRTMPPAGTDLDDADRATLEHWLSTPR